MPIQLLKFMESNRAIGLLMLFMGIAIALRPEAGTAKIMGQTSPLLPPLFIVSLVIGGVVLIMRDVSPATYLMFTLPFLLYCIALVATIMIIRGPFTAIVVYGFAYTVALCRFFTAIDEEEQIDADPRTGEGAWSDYSNYRRVQYPHSEGDI